MNLIDIYIFEIGKHLPNRSRTDIQEEIRSTLQDLLEDRSQQTGRPVDEALTMEVLREFGSPEQVATAYLPERYLIGPRLFPAFLKTVQIVLPIIAILAMIGLSISLGKADFSAGNWLETIIQAIAEFFNTVIIALGNLVLIFAILEWALPNLREKPKTWDPASLKKISPPDRVTIGEPIAAIILNFAAIVVFNFYPQAFGALFVAGRGWTFTQILSEAFFRFLPALTLLWAFKILLNIILLRQGQWQTWTRWFSLGTQALEVGVASALLRGPSLIALTAQDLAAAGPFPLQAAQTLIELLNQVVTWLLVLIIVLGIVEIVKTVIRLLKGKTPVSFVQAK